MANDREILREIWEGKLPICFRLDSEEVADVREPDPFYLMVPRLSYFPLVTDKIKRHFLKYVDCEKSEQEMWLEYNGQPLKWHYPIGVLFDLSFDKDEILPWNIIVHFDKFPEAEIFRFSNKDMVEAYFMSCLKEADVLKHRGQIAGSMQKKDHNQLWLGLQNDKFDQFWAVNRKLMETTNDQDHFKYIPFRCYMDSGYKQKLVKPVTEGGAKKTLQDLINEIFPENGDVKVKTHGLIPPSDTPLQWLSEHLSYPDNFLHLCVTS
ncbi:autophagy protein 5 [Diabrotica virgifera virgifera]|uniref:Autophagy protein 5 n=1 Tax=Diabrotica virgifera virgifera TaxID=50390 RepID=A0ABM5L6A6_DIAVI|nr:autophagy protein 5 [Diabrotica virgifera virgifera]